MEYVSATTPYYHRNHCRFSGAREGWVVWPSLFCEWWERWNSPYINHFIQPDTIIPDQTNPQSWNRFSYVNNNPLRFTDPTGHYACGDGEEHDCSGHRQDPIKNPHQTKSSKTAKHKGAAGNCSGASCHGIQSISGTNPYIGTPQNLGSQVSGVWVGGGTPNQFGVMGFTLDDGVAGVNAGLAYNTTYSIEFYEHGAQLHLTERYSLSENTYYTDVDTAGAILNVKTSDGTMGNVSLGEFDVTEGEVRNTTVTIYGSYPTEMNISVLIKLSNSVTVSAPLPNYQFDNNPVSVWP